MNNNLLNFPLKFLLINDTKLKLGRLLSKINSLLYTLNMLIIYRKNFYTHRKKAKFLFIYKYTGTILKKYYFNNYYGICSNKYIWKNIINKNLYAYI